MRNYLLACFALSAAATLAACGSSTSSGENVTADRYKEAFFSDLIDMPASELKQLMADDERCSAAISGGAAITSEDIDSCTNVHFIMGRSCDDGNDLSVITKDDTNWLLRVGTPAADLGADYALSDLATACGDPTTY